ncbi:MAG TPA: hypothetical protein ENG95_00315, partial [Nitrospirae bacterium]|nr:hypothetical protein [Nitrospirota bacterium]
MKKLIALFIITLTIGMVIWWRSPATVQGPLSEQEFEYIVRTSGNADPSEALPMIIALHGHGDTPDNFFNTLLKGFDHPARFIMIKGPVDYPGVDMSGSAWPTEAGELSECGNAVADAVSVLLERYPTEGLPILLGFSSGAYMSYYIAAFHANKFSHIFPLSGRLLKDLMSTEIVSYENGARIIAFHGNSDQIVGLNQGKAAVRNLRQRGLTAELVTFNGGHLEVFYSAKHLLMNHL